MTNIVWDDSWNSYYKSIDEQHHVLIDIVNGLNTEKNNIATTIESLIDYSALHFADEEALMVSVNYPKPRYLEHRAEHNLLKHTLLDFSFLLSYLSDDSKKLKLQVNVFEKFVSLWFSNHFLLADKKFTEWLNNNNSNGGANTSS